MDYIVRKANQADVPTLLNFMQGLIAAERPMDPTIRDGDISYYDIPMLISETDSEVYVVELDNEIVASGYAKIKEDRSYLKHSLQGYLGFMYVPETHRGKGLNKLIMDALLKWCKQRKVFEIRLDVYNVNEPAIRAYEKAGFTKHMIQMRLDIENIDL